MSATLEAAPIPCADEEQAAQHLHLLGNPLVEIRAIRRDGPPSANYFDDIREAADHAAGLAALSGTDEFAGVFATANRINEDLRGRCDNKGTRAAHITRLVTLPIDVDSNRNHPDGGKVCATEDEHDGALSLAETIRRDMMQAGWPEPIFVDTGNGARLDFRIDLTNTRENVALVEATLKELARRYDFDAAHVDTSVGDPPRVIRLAGTVNRKSQPTDKRPNRPVFIRSAPNRLEAVTSEQLHDFVGCVPIASAPNSASDSQNATIDSPSHVSGSDLHHSQRVQVIVQCLDSVSHPHGLPDDTDERFTKIDLPTCPFKVGGTPHTDGRTAILIWRDGGIAVKCFHEKCRDKSWAEFRKVAKLPFAELASEAATKNVTGRPDRLICDPLFIAEQHLGKMVAPDGASQYVHFLGESYAHDTVDGWVKKKPAEIAAFVRATAQDLFDRHAAEQSTLTGVNVKSVPIRGQLVPDTIKAMDSLCRREISIKTQPPFWLQPHEWCADDLLVFRNGILNIRGFVEGQPANFIPPTPRLFHEHHADFDFVPDAPYPATWHRFLDSLERPPEWRESLREIMGYILWRGYDLQKYFELVGPPRSGKGTIARVMRDLAGGVSAICAPNLEDFATSFGLEQAIGKRLAIVPEVRLPEDAHEIVARLKAITGGDMVTVNRKHIPNIPMYLRLKIIFQSNNFVPLPDNSGALHSRLVLLMLTKSFVGHEDTTLGEKLAEEYGGILLWALEGLRNLWRNGGVFTIPRDSAEQLDQLRAESAPLQAFLEQTCILDTQRGCQSPALYEVYRAWESDGCPLSENSFANELRAAAPMLVKKRATKPNERDYKGRIIVETEFDVPATRRPWLWLGIAPKAEWRSQIHDKTV